MDIQTIKLGIEILVLLCSLIGTYFWVKFSIKRNTEDIALLKLEFDKHLEVTPICNKKFEDLRLDINRLQTEENMKHEYQTQIVEKILQPVLKEMNDKIVLYVDTKIGVLNKEIESIRVDNIQFRTEVKEIIKDLKEENNRSIDRIVKILESKN